MEVKKEVFGTTKDGRQADLYTITNAAGTTAKFTNYGAILVEFWVADARGEMADVVLGYDNLESYFVNGPNFGATIGRHANRIGGAKFTLNGVTYQLDQNDGNNNLHGGFNGYHKRLWEGRTYETEEGQAMEFTYHSPDGDQGFPGNLDVKVVYTLTEDNQLKIAYEAVSDQDTVLNLTNHSYFNLAGHNSGTVLDQLVWIDADEFTVADAESIPTGEIAKVAGTPMDFTKEKTIGQDINSDYQQLIWGTGFDHNWVLKTAPGNFGLVAKMTDEKSGRVMETWTDMQGIQFYTANFLDGTEVGKGGVKYVQRSAACFETQFYPNGINRANFPQPVLKAGETYRSTTVYKFYTK